MLDVATDRLWPFAANNPITHFRLFQLFDGQVRRFSDLERLLPGVTKKMLTQQLKGMEKEGIVLRTAHPGFPLRVDYRISAWGKTLCPVMDSLLQWYEQREDE